jgi:hypothetical protein
MSRATGRSTIRLPIELTSDQSGVVRQLTLLGKRYDVHALKRFAPAKRHEMLACFLVEIETSLLDQLVEMHDQYLTTCGAARAVPSAPAPFPVPRAKRFTCWTGCWRTTPSCVRTSIPPIPTGLPSCSSGVVTCWAIASCRDGPATVLVVN